MSLKFTPRVGLVSAILLFVISLSVALPLAFCKPDSGSQDGNDEQETKWKDDGVITTSADYTYTIDISAYASALNTTESKYLLLANKTYVIGESYTPPGTVTVIDAQYTLNGKELSLAGNAAIAAEAMLKEMRACGYTDIYITSGYRSYEYQMSLYHTYFNREKAAHPDWTDEQIKAQVLTYSAYPGTSEHQTGLCMDLFVSPDMKELENYGREGTYPDDVGFAETDEFKWLLQNAYKFGFILRYPEDKVDVTGYSYESWHYRFVGIDAATDIYENGLTLEEYLGK
ncbi:MAG: M15 family metallopeptidase [Clostridia bacterium]|nr:M15 family metallopeptidase [Clostridia bacterium]